MTIEHLFNYPSHHHFCQQQEITKYNLKIHIFLNSKLIKISCLKKIPDFIQVFATLPATTRQAGKTEPHRKKIK